MVRNIYGKGDDGTVKTHLFFLDVHISVQDLYTLTDNSIALPKCPVEMIEICLQKITSGMGFVAREISWDAKLLMMPAGPHPGRMTPA